MTGRKNLLAGLAGVSAVAGIVAVSGPASAAAKPEPAHAAQAPTAATGAQPGTTTGAPTSAKVPVTGQVQQKNSWCAVATSSMSLRSMGVKVTQATLAKQMGTDNVGTEGDKMPPVLNKYASPKGYSYGWTDARTKSTLLNALSYDIGVLRRDPLLVVYGTKLPWNEGAEHSILAYGYNKANNTITVWDPSPVRGGSHVINVNTLAGAMEKYGLGYITKK